MNSSRTLQNTLYVTSEGSYLHLDNDTIRVEVERQTRLRVPLHHLASVVCIGDVLVSPALLGTCAERGIGICLLDRQGRFRARVEGAASGNILLRIAQYRAADDPVARLAVSQRIVQGKLRNARIVLQRGARDSSSEADRDALEAAVRHFDASLRAVPSVDDLDHLRGVEGDSARVYFGAMEHMIRADRRIMFRPDGRTRRPPRDRCNALLSFLYTLLTHDCASAAEVIGLDPQLGFLHAVRPGRPGLALDLVEEFRAVIADRLALTLINRGQIGEDDFRKTEGGAVLLTDEGRRAVVTAWQERKADTVTHPLLDCDVPYGLLPHVQARLLARALRGDTEGYLPYLHR